MGIIKKQGIANTALVYIGTLIGAVSLLFIQPVYLTKDELGLTRLVLSFATVLSSLLSFGISSVTVRYLPRLFDQERGHRGFFGFVLLYLGISVSLGLLFLLLMKGTILDFYGDGAHLFSDNFRFVILLSVSYSFVLGFNSYCMALLRSVFPTFLNDIVVRLLFVAIILAHFAGWLDLQQFLLAFCLIYTAQAVVLLVYTLVVDRPSFVPDLGHMRREIGLGSILRYGAIITFTSINSVSLKYLDSIFVGGISLGHVAVYSVAAFIGLIIELPLGALERIANPAIAHAMAAKDMENIRTVYHRSARLLLILGGWTFIMVVLNVHDLLQLLPPGYSDGWQVAVVIAFGALINMATGINFPILVNSDRYIYGSVFLIALVAITFVGNLLLIPRIGMMGAAITACIGNVVYNGLKFEFIRRRFGMQPLDRTTFKITALITIIVLVGWSIPIPWSPVPAILIRAVLASAAYVIAIGRFRLGDELRDYLPSGLARQWLK